MGGLKMQYRNFSFDIEVLPRGTVFPDPALAERPVISFAAHDNFTNQYITVAQRNDLAKARYEVGTNTVLFVPNEGDLFALFTRFIQVLDPDLLIGWYVDFDIKYMIKRAQRLRFDLTPISPMGELNTKSQRTGRHIDYVPGRLVFDLAKGYKAIAKPLGSSLKDVSKAEGVHQKAESPLSIPEWYRDDIWALVEYNHGDVRAMVEIDAKHKVIDHYMGMKAFAGLEDINDTFYHSVGLDAMLLRLAYGDNIVLPSKPHEKGEWYRGAIVLEPKVGLHPMVGLFDFTRFYPSIMLSLNLSPETIDPNGDIDCGTFRTRSSPIGIVPRLYLWCNKQRDLVEAELAKTTPGTTEYKIFFQKRDIVKFYSNATYGMMAYPNSRVYKVEIAAKIAEVAREGILFAKDVFEDLGYPALAGDTDSIFIQLLDDVTEDPRAVAKIGQKLAAQVTNELTKFAKDNYGIDQHEFKMGFDRLFQRIVFVPKETSGKGVTKKRYGGWVVWEKGKVVGYLKIIGFEKQRGDQAPVTHDLQERVIKHVTKGLDPEIIVNHVANLIHQVKAEAIPLDQLAIRTTLGKALGAYGGTNKRGHRTGVPPFARGAQYANQHLGTNFERGSLVKMLYVKTVFGLPQTDVVCFEDINTLPEIVIDKPKMIDRTIRKKVERILMMAGIPWSMVDGTKTLDKYFGGS